MSLHRWLVRMVTVVACGGALLAATGADVVDDDNDGLPNEYENRYDFLDPGDPSDALGDADADWLTNLGEYHAGTSPTNSDTDCDGLLDGWEVRYGTDPLVRNGGVGAVQCEQLGEWVPGGPNGSASRVCLDADRAYVAITHVGGDPAVAAGSVVILSTTNPAAPVLLGTIETPGGAVSVCVTGEYAYVADYDAGLQIYDVRDAASPRRVGAFPTNAGVLVAYDVCVCGDYAYVAGGSGGLRVLDVSDPTAPAPVGTGTVDVNTDNFLSVDVVGDLACVADGNRGLRVFDVSNPAVPRLLGTAATGYAADVAVSGPYAYVACSSYGLRVVSVTNTRAPVVLGTHDTSGYALGVVVDDVNHLAFVADDSGGLQVVGVADPENPYFMGHCDMPAEHAGDVAVGGGYAFVADAEAGLVAVDVRAYQLPVIVGRFGTAHRIVSVCVTGDYAYVADAAGLAVLRVDAPESVTEVGGCSTLGIPQGVVVRGAYAYIADGRNGLQLVDVSDPAAPRRGPSWTDDGVNGLGIAVAGNFAYLAADRAGLVVLDVSTPGGEPTRWGQLDTPGWAQGVAVSGSHAYVADGYSGLRVIDISVPATPRFSGVCDTDGRAMNVAVQGSYAYVADSGGLVDAVDVSDPAGPVRVGRCDPAGYGAYDVAVSGGIAYLATGDHGLAVIDAGSPTNLAVAGSWWGERCLVQGIAVVPPMVWLAAGDRVLAIRCDYDGDRDGLPDDYERDQWGDLSRTAADDDDFDGALNGVEFEAGCDPRAADSDGDGVLDGSELTIYGTDPSQADSDGDGVDDGEEVADGADGYVTDALDPDSDDDRVDDGLELALGRNPTNPEPAYVELFFDDMESGTGKWHADAPWVLTHDDYSSEHTSWTESPWAVHGTDVNAALTLSEPLDLSGYAHAWLGFVHALDVRDDLRANPRARVEVSTDGGSNWTVEATYELRTFSWRRERFDLSRACGHAAVLVRFVFDSHTEWDVAGDGWHIDDVGIYGAVGMATGQVTGRGVPIARADVRLQPRFAEGGEFTRSAVTDLTGAYTLAGLVPGHYVIKADAAGYAAQYYNHASRRSEATDMALIFGEGRSIDFDLAMGVAPASLRVSSTPANAVVWLDFAASGQATPARFDDVELGWHLVWVSHFLYPAPAPKVVDVIEGEEAAVDFRLGGDVGGVQVVSTPLVGADVFLDFQPTGLKTPCVLPALSVTTAGEGHYVSVAKAGVASPPPRQVSVRAGAMTNVVFSLPVGELGTLQVTSSPTGAVVWLDAVDTGVRTDGACSEVTAGAHLLTVRLAGFAELPARWVMVESGGVVAAHFNLHVEDATDVDGDGIPDVWEEATGLSADPDTGSVGTQGAAGDVDGDGMANADERLAGTSPGDAASVLAVVACEPEVDPADPVAIRWASVPGKLYQVESCAVLGVDPWTAISGVIEAVGTSCVFADSRPSGGQPRYYRVMVFPYP